MPQRMPRDPDGTSMNARTSQWRGYSSTGAYGLVRQVTTGVNQFTFQEIWFRGKGPGLISTEGRGTFTPSTNINIYEYKSPPGVVVVRTREAADDMQTEDTVLASTLALFKPGETITYTLRP